MFAKCAVLIVTVGACGCALLALRQQRLQVASELARTQLRIVAHDERLWLLRAKIAQQTSPRNVERLARTLGPLTPIVDQPVEPPLGVGPTMANVVPRSPAPVVRPPGSSEAKRPSRGTKPVRIANTDPP